MPSIFDQFASAFILVSDEDKRWQREGPLLTLLARSSGSGRGRVLDLACGNGFHSRHLAAEGLDVTGVDISASSIETGKTLPSGDGVKWSVGDITRRVDGEYDLVILVGNTLSLLKDAEDVKSVFASASAALVESGAMVLHTIDYDYLRRHPVRIRRSGTVEGREVEFEKQIDGTGSGALITIASTTTRDGTEQTATQTQELKEWTDEFLREAARDSGFEIRNEYGGLDGSGRQPGETKDRVLVIARH